MKLRRILFWMHLATGCLAGAVVLVMSVTGVLLAYERQIISWIDRDFHSSQPPAGSAPLPIETMLTGVTAQNRSLPSAITLRSDPAAPAEASFGPGRVFLVDVYTGNVLGASSPGARAFFQKVENWHRWLGADQEHRTGGRAVTGACNFGFMLLVISGPFLWIPRKWSWQSVKNITLFRGGLSGRARDFNWHNAIGIWCAVPLVVIVFSGVVMSYPWANNLLYKATGSEPPVQGNGQRPQSDGQPRDRGQKANAGSRRPEGSRNGEPQEPGFQGMNLLWARAGKQVSGWKSLTLRMPASGRGPVTFTIDTGDGGRPDQRSQLTLNRRTAEVVRWEPFSTYNSGRRLRSWLRFLHTGEAGGFTGRTIAGLASCGAAMLVWTGLWLACRRFLRWRRRGQPVASEGATTIRSQAAGCDAA